MEAAGGIFIMVAIGLFILQIVMIVKFFDIASDAKAIRNMMERYFNNQHAGDNSIKNIVAVQSNSDNQVNEPIEHPNFKDVTYTQEDDTIHFSNGLSGKLKSRFGQWHISNMRGEGAYSDKEEAIRVLYEGLTELDLRR